MFNTLAYVQAVSCLRLVLRQSAIQRCIAKKHMLTLCGVFGAASHKALSITKTRLFKYKEKIHL